MSISAKLATESETTVPDPYSPKSDWMLPSSFGITACFLFFVCFVLFCSVLLFFFFVFFWGGGV